MHCNKTDKLTEVLNLTAVMSAEENSSILLRKGLELCATILDCERGFIIAQQQENFQIIEKTAAIDTNSFSTTALSLVKEKREPLLISDTISNELLGTQESINRNDIRSILCTLLTDVTNSIGNKDLFYLYLDSSTNRHPFSFDDLERFKLLSRIMSTLLAKSEQIARQGAAIEALQSKIEEKRFNDLIFGSESINKCLKLLSQSAPTDVPILLIGETGTGKERMARIAHDLSPRKEKTFLAVNCGAIPSNLIESHLFGHEKGAFTGAVSMRKGYFEEASGGTLFLDEIGELPLQVQSQFLRALQEGEIIRVGSSKPIHVDVRIVAATNVDLEQAAQSGTFRKDLYYRLNVIQVRIPPVRERSEDALLLARFFLKKFGESFGKQMNFSRETEKAILLYDWPGNVREIQNKVQRAVITSMDTIISPETLGLKENKPAHSTLREAREAVDRELIQYALSRSPNNLTNAAKILDIDRKSLRILLEKYGMNTDKMEM